MTIGDVCRHFSNDSNRKQKSAKKQVKNLFKKKAAVYVNTIMKEVTPSLIEEAKDGGNTVSYSYKHTHVESIFKRPMLESFIAICKENPKLNYYEIVEMLKPYIKKYHINFDFYMCDADMLEFSYMSYWECIKSTVGYIVLAIFICIFICEIAFLR